MKKVSFIFGTRPEAVKLCPLVLAMKEHPGFDQHVCVTAQHREMLDQVLKVFDVMPDMDLNLMKPGQPLAALTSRAINSIYDYLAQHKPDLVLVQGDTTTVFCAALAAFYNKIPVGHVEAGLRTYNKFSPYPEEINRVLSTHIADYHFAPTKWAQQNLLKEAVPIDRIYVTGNTVIDALHIAVSKLGKRVPEIQGVPKELICNESEKPIVLITGHRRESFGQGFRNICTAIAKLAEKFSEVIFIYSVHLNPNVREPVFQILSGRENVYLIEPLDYLTFVALMNQSSLILTDSGGVQEEAPSLGKPVLVMRDFTERPEAIRAGTAKLIGTNTENIIHNVSLLLTDKQTYNMMVQAVNPYGDGKASQRILKAIEEQI